MANSKYDEVQFAHEFDISVESREIFLHDEIDSDVATRFIKNMRILGARSNKPVVIHQYSVGGDWSAGMAIFDIIYFFSCPVLFITHGCAASMGSVIPQSVRPGKGYRITNPNCDWLIHEGHIFMDHTNRAAASTHEANKIATEKMYDVYVGSCRGAEYFKGEKDSKIRAFLKRKLSSKEDWWISADEAVQYGFADGVLGAEGYETIEKIREYL